VAVPIGRYLEVPVGRRRGRTARPWLIEPIAFFVQQIADRLSPGARRTEMKKTQPSRPALTLGSKTIRSLSAIDLTHAAGGLDPVSPPSPLIRYAPEPHPW
jgi:hypothetical protein